MAQSQSLIRREQATAAFVEELGCLPMACPDVVQVDHPGGLPQPAGARSADFRPNPTNSNQI
jgi:hypothetical protein